MFIIRKQVLMVLCLVLLFLSGCSSKPKLTFEQLAAWKDEVFVSEFGGFSVDAPQKWTYLSDEEIKTQLEGLDNVIYETPQVSLDEFQKSTGLYPLVFVHEGQDDEGEGFVAYAFVIFERLGVLERLSVKTSDKYLELLKDDYIKEDTHGIYYSYGDVYSMNIGEDEYRCLPMVLNAYQLKQVIAVRIKDDFVIALLITAPLNHSELIDEALDAFAVFQ
ncbi:MAG: hypothetical protein Q8S15_10905 [Erysipelotrichaceae bacterium]|nr:hypothetical protein [Erysipelotrichaceae bacterium]